MADAVVAGVLRIALAIGIAIAVFVHRSVAVVVQAITALLAELVVGRRAPAAAIEQALVDLAVAIVVLAVANGLGRGGGKHLALAGAEGAVLAAHRHSALTHPAALGIRRAIVTLALLAAPAVAIRVLSVAQAVAVVVHAVLAVLDGPGVDGAVVVVAIPAERAAVSIAVLVPVDAGTTVGVTVRPAVDVHDLGDANAVGAALVTSGTVGLGGARDDTGAVAAFLAFGTVRRTGAGPVTSAVAAHEAVGTVGIRIAAHNPGRRG
jgi:hypothetical protein